MKRNKSTTGKRSGFEDKVGQSKTCSALPYEQHKFEYVVTHTYKPDWVDPSNKIMYEAKGRFTSKDRSKMLAVKKNYPDWKIVIILQRPNNTLNKTSKTTYADWCTKHGFEWKTLENL